MWHVATDRRVQIWDVQGIPERRQGRERERERDLYVCIYIYIYMCMFHTSLGHKKASRLDLGSLPSRNSNFRPVTPTLSL